MANEEVANAIEVAKSLRGRGYAEQLRRGSNSSTLEQRVKHGALVVSALDHRRDGAGYIRFGSGDALGDEVPQCQPSSQRLAGIRQTSPLLDAGQRDEWAPSKHFRILTVTDRLEHQPAGVLGLRVRTHHSGLHAKPHFLAQCAQATM